MFNKDLISTKRKNFDNLSSATQNALSLFNNVLNDLRRINEEAQNNLNDINKDIDELTSIAEDTKKTISENNIVINKISTLLITEEE